MATFEYAYDIKPDGCIIRNKCEVFTRANGTTLLDDPITRKLYPQVRDNDNNWVDEDLTTETAETVAIANAVWTDAVKEAFRNNN